MNKYLPIVKMETTYSLIGNLQNADDFEYIERRLDEIEKVNPIVSKWIKNFSKTSKSRLLTAYCGLMVYELLYSQAEADVMNEMFS
jgi:tetrahydromethanopterin S-methyltransferase subunit G